MLFCEAESHLARQEISDMCEVVRFIIVFKMLNNGYFLRQLNPLRNF